jgi:hypothetical protein
MNGLRSFERWDGGFESHSMLECLCAFILRLCVRVRVGVCACACACACVRAKRPCDGSIPRPRSLTVFVK